MPIAAASDLFTQAIVALRDDSDLLELLPGGIWPKVTSGTSPLFTQTPARPFGYLRELTVTPVGRAGSSVATFAFETHALAAAIQSSAAIRRQLKQAQERAEVLLDLTRWELPTESLRAPLESVWRGYAGLYPDQGWNTSKYIGTFIVDTQ